MGKNTTRKEITEALSAVTQLGIRVAVSFLLWIFAAQWVRRTFGLGNYVSVIGVILGAGSGALSFWKFCVNTVKRAEVKNGRNEKGDSSSSGK